MKHIRYIILLLIASNINILLFAQTDSTHSQIKQPIFSPNSLFYPNVQSTTKNDSNKNIVDSLIVGNKNTTLLRSNIHSSQTLSEDSLLILSDEECKYCKVDRYDSLLQSWFYYTGRDSINYLRPNERNNVYVDFPDSVYEERLRQIISPVELSYNKVVQKSIDRYIKNGKWHTPKILGLSYQFFPIFEQMLDAHGIPIELKYLAVIESALVPTAKSSSGAAGLWQFIFQTGRAYGLEINSYIDERMDIVKSTEVACKYLKKLNSTYNDWILTIAAYNCGPGTLNNAIRRAGGKTNYWDIYPYLPYETRNYVPNFIAAAYLFECYQDHGFKPEPYPFFNDIDTVMVKKELHFAQLDSILGISVEQSRELNPQYRLDIIPAKTKSYPLRIRHQYVAKFIELEDSIYKYNDSLYFNPNKYQYTPNEQYDEYKPLATQPAGTTELKYIVKSGDVVGLISTWYGVKNAEIRAWNGVGNDLQVGKVLKIYVPNDKVDKYRNINSMSFEEKQKSVGIDPITNQIKEEEIDPSYEYYTVQSGDYPMTIAKKTNISVEELMRINNITDPSSLRIGQKLKIKKK